MPLEVLPILPDFSFWPAQNHGALVNLVFDTDPLNDLPRFDAAGAETRLKATRNAVVKNFSVVQEDRADKEDKFLALMVPTNNGLDELERSYQARARHLLIGD